MPEDQSREALELTPADDATAEEEAVPDLQVAALEAELARLRPIEAAAQEARAFLEGRRPGFSSSYVLDLLRTALDEKGENPSPYPTVKGGWNAAGAHRRRQGGRGRRRHIQR